MAEFPHVSLNAKARAFVPSFGAVVTQPKPLPIVDDDGDAAVAPTFVDDDDEPVDGAAFAVGPYEADELGEHALGAAGTEPPVSFEADGTGTQEDQRVSIWRRRTAACGLPSQPAVRCD
jgi:hypothetical protein